MKKLKIALISFAIFIAVVFAAFFIYASDYYRADYNAIEKILSDSTYSKIDNMSVLTPPTASDTALIFYPGGKVENLSYLPLLYKLSNNGITCILVKMPFNLAVFDVNAANDVYNKFPNIKHWYVGGHSLGGAMASSYAAKNLAKLDGLILLGAYIYGDVPPEKALTIYGTQDAGLDLSKINYSKNVVVIDGGNHAQFGNYGIQKGDGIAEISQEQQQDYAVQEILRFISAANNTNR